MIDDISPQRIDTLCTIECSSMLYHCKRSIFWLIILIRPGYHNQVCLQPHRYMTYTNAIGPAQCFIAVDHDTAHQAPQRTGAQTLSSFSVLVDVVYSLHCGASSYYYLFGYAAVDCRFRRLDLAQQTLHYVGCCGSRLFYIRFQAFLDRQGSVEGRA